ncbi:MAG: ABC transporter ATP-binding protein [Promethearchaeota archaeon]|nr:MAG: ABC transporter ATP-binding protein [Candidatus Lokiarchaeota archaeon]
MALINFHNFSFRYKGNENYALKDINLEIEENKFILLLGETGSGKTTLIRCMNGLIPQFYSGFYRGSVAVKGADTSKVPIADLSTIVGIVFQNPENQLVSMNVEHEIAFGLENWGFPREHIRKKIKEVSELTGIKTLLEKAPFEISGGEQQRVAIASILALEPEILILDEPTSNLDPYFAEKIITLLKELQKKKKISVIISEHRLDLILPLADEIILMKKGEVIQHDEKKKVLNGDIFKDLDINKPFYYSIFHTLKEKGIFDEPLPFSLEDALKVIKKKL